MAITNQIARVLTIVKTVFADSLIESHGIAVLSGGTIELDTGLREVVHFEATVAGDTADDALVFRFREADIPTKSGVITVDAIKVAVGLATANAGSEQFTWKALGRA